MGHATSVVSGGIVRLVAAVVGRSGAAMLAVGERGGHESRAQALSVLQQPPPSETGQDLNPEEQTSELATVDVLEVVVVVVVIVVEGGMEEELDKTTEVVGDDMELVTDPGTTTIEVATEGDAAEVGEIEVELDDGDGAMMMVEVELIAHP